MFLAGEELTLAWKPKPAWLGGATMLEAGVSTSSPHTGLPIIEIGTIVRSLRTTVHQSLPYTLKNLPFIVYPQPFNPLPYIFCPKLVWLGGATMLEAGVTPRANPTP